MGTYINNILEGNELTVAQLAITEPGALAVFTKYNIDYCCGGHRTLEEACNRIGLDAEKIRREIYKTSPSNAGQVLRPDTWTSTFLCDFIVENHHSFVRKAMPELEVLLEKVCERHGSDCEELLSIKDIFSDLGKELRNHMEKEELILFPAIRRLESYITTNHPMEVMIQSPIAAMEDDHETAGDLIKEMRALSNNYTPPDFACPTFRITYQKLKEFDNDLMKHIHLENNILFPRFKRPATLSSCLL